MKLEGLTGVQSLRKTWERHFKVNPGAVDPATHTNGEGIYGRLATPKMSDQIHSKLLDLILTGRHWRQEPGDDSLYRSALEHVKPLPIFIVAKKV